MPISERSETVTRRHAEALAAHALGFLGQDPERLGHFLAVTGLGPETLRHSAEDPAFLHSVLEHLMGDESLLLAFCANSGVEPQHVVIAQAVLAEAET